MSRQRWIQDPEAYNTPENIARMMEASARDIRRTGPGTLIKVKVQVWFAGREEVEASLAKVPERRIRLREERADG